MAFYHRIMRQHTPGIETTISEDVSGFKESSLLSLPENIYDAKIAAWLHRKGRPIINYNATIKKYSRAKNLPLSLMQCSPWFYFQKGKHGIPAFLLSLTLCRKDVPPHGSFIRQSTQGSFGYGYNEKSPKKSSVRIIFKCSHLSKHLASPHSLPLSGYPREPVVPRPLLLQNPLVCNIPIKISSNFATTF
jgi:hypothetical protein